MVSYEGLHQQLSKRQMVISHLTEAVGLSSRTIAKINIVPFIIEDSKKSFYYRGLSQWPTEKGYLTDTCLDGQDTFIALLNYFNIKP